MVERMTTEPQMLVNPPNSQNIAYALFLGKST